ncbi:MAG: multicopper oxidase domain-containing protein [Actinobacteria bacterium]|nr:multicopper oxidase domain-containing protein [Actinomycetota bacterium]
MSLNRRDLLKTGVFAGAAVALPTARFVGADTAARMPESKLPKPFSLPFKQAPIAVPYRKDATCEYYKMDMMGGYAEIIPGFKSYVMGYNGIVPGPTIKARKGIQTVVRHCNQLDAVHPVLGYTPWTSVHLHGSGSLPQYDGYASDIAMPPGGVREDGTVCTNGEYKDYHYPNYQKARTLWYHDHGVHHTAENAYHGLVAQYHLHDAEEQTLGIPTSIYDPTMNGGLGGWKGEYDVALTVGDLMFQSDGNLLFSLDNQSGHWGDVIHVNGVPWPVMRVKRRKYRFRVLAASISRSFKFSLNDPTTAQKSYGTQYSYQIIGTDGGLMPAPVTVKSHRQLSGERYEIVVDFGAIFKGKAKGSRVVLNNTSPKNNLNYTNTHQVMAFEVVDDAYDTSVTRGNGNAVPAKLSAINDIMNLTPAMSVATRRLRLERSGGAWTINGTTWDKIIQSNYQFVEAAPTVGTVETWIIENSSGGWFHPLHIHLVDFKILSRNGQPPMPHERGPKDVVYTGENETVTLLVRFDSLGKYMVHCHNLVHEDHDMMTQFEVVGPAGEKGDDPMYAAVARDMEFEATDVL